MPFKPPNDLERITAIGPLNGLSPPLQRAFTPGVHFEPVPRPRPGDWLAEHPEPGQPFREFARSDPLRPDSVHRKVYLQPLEFEWTSGPCLETLRAGAAAYFVMDVSLLDPLALTDVTTRRNPYTGNRQILTIDILHRLKIELPTDAYCLLAVSMQDLYPHPSWNFVFGQASLRERVGVFSFARYDPAFYGPAEGSGDGRLLLRRSCRVLVHEIAHMFTLTHCIFFRCIMNGSNHLQESDSRPLRFCPVCLRKLQHSIGFDVVDRYENLAEFHRRAGFLDEFEWVRRRISWIQGN